MLSTLRVFGEGQLGQIQTEEMNSGSRFSLKNEVEVGFMETH
jgi:hypothetical protein